MSVIASKTPPSTERPAASTVLRGYVEKIRGGDVGALPAVIGLIVLCVVFSVLRSVFLSDLNFANLLTQGAGVTIIAMGLVFVLLLGEIDLSAGFTSGLTAAILAVLLTNHGWPWYGAVVAALAAGAVVGLVLGTIVSKLGIPSFVTTLAAFLAFQGFMLIMMSGGTAIGIHDDTILAIANKNVPPTVSWIVYSLGIVVFAAIQLRMSQTRAARGLSADPLLLIGIRVGVVALILGFAIYSLNQERSRNALIVSLKGVPIVVPVIAVLLILWTFVLKRTAYGRHLYAVGGNAEAARRAGINVDAIKISAFVICSTMAAIGGIITASRANSVDPNTGGSNVLLYAVGAAVIGGTSLFGGRGRVLDAVIGGAVVAVIDNGMGLMGYSAGVKYVVTGFVLLLAASVDALSRRRAASTGV